MDNTLDKLQLSYTSCPWKSCYYCRKAPRAHPFHSICFKLLHKASTSGTTLERLWNLGQAQTSLFQMDRRMHEDTLTLLKESFCRVTCERIIKIINIGQGRDLKEHKCSDNKCSDNKCTFCLFRHLCRLPNEILSGHIALLIAPSFFQRVLLVFGETLNLSIDLELYPARSFSISSRNAVFESRTMFGGISYITGLYNEMVTDSRIVEGSDTRYNLIAVWANDLGITAIEFLSSLDSISKQPGWLYVIVATTESIYVRSKVCLTSRHNILTNV